MADAGGLPQPRIRPAVPDSPPDAGSPKPPLHQGPPSVQESHAVTQIALGVVTVLAVIAWVTVGAFVTAQLISLPGLAFGYLNLMAWYYMPWALSWALGLSAVVVLLRLKVRGGRAHVMISIATVFVVLTLLTLCGSREMAALLLR